MQYKRSVVLQEESAKERRERVILVFVVKQKCAAASSSGTCATRGQVIAQASRAKHSHGCNPSYYPPPTPSGRRVRSFSSYLSRAVVVASAASGSHVGLVYPVHLTRNFLFLCRPRRTVFSLSISSTSYSSSSASGSGSGWESS